MTDNLVDLFFSFRGRIDRQAWWLGAVAIAAAAVAGTALFNDDSFDESANAIRGSLTMAAFLWLMLCLFALTALSAKRLNDCDRAPGLRHTVSLPGAIVICGWGAGYFLDPLTVSGEMLAFWVLLAQMVPAIIACAALPGENEEH